MKKFLKIFLGILFLALLVGTIIGKTKCDGFQNQL